MNCPFCGEEMREGYLYSSKDGAFSFSNEVPGIFKNASKEEGFIKITSLKNGGRTNVKACVCEKCRKIVFSY